jgi:hypothetical protein
MRVLFIYEQGPAQQSLHQLKCCAQALRAQFEGVRIILATNNNLPDVDLTWVDKVYSTVTVKIQTNHVAEGPWRHLHNAGWTDPTLRQTIYQSWSVLLRKLKPDAIVASGAHSAMLVAVLENIRVIQVGDSQLIADVKDWPKESSFPELEHWLHNITGRTAGQLIDKPGVVFAAKSLDRDRTGLILRVAPDLAGVGKKDFKGQVLAIWDTRHVNTTELMEKGQSLWGDGFVMISPEEAFTDGYSIESIAEAAPLIITQYDMLWSSKAIELGLPLFGTPLRRHQVEIGERAEQSRLSYGLSGDMRMLEDYHREAFVFDAWAKGRTESAKGQFCDLGVAMRALLEKR